MKKKEFSELKNKSQVELIKSLKEKKTELTKAYAEVHAGKEKNLKKMKLVKRDIAQILTVVKEMQIQESLGKETKKE